MSVPSGIASFRVPRADEVEKEFATLTVMPTYHLGIAQRRGTPFDHPATRLSFRCLHTDADYAIHGI